MAEKPSTLTGWRLRTLAVRKALGPLAFMHGLAALRGSKLGLRAHLVIFGLAIVVPVLLYSAFLLHRYTLSVHASEERRALQIARALSADVDREITGIVTTLETLATSDALATRDFRSFYVQAKEALRSRPWNVVLIDLSRRQLVNTRLDWGVTPPMSNLSEPDLPRIARETGRPYVSDLFVGTVAQRWIFSVSVPVRPRKEAEYALVMSLEPERLMEILQGESLPPGWLAGIADRKNINMARTREAEQFLGKPVPEASVKQYAGKSEGVIRATDFEGQDSLQAFHFSSLTGWRVAAWAPLSLVEGPLREAWTVFLWSGAVLLSLSVLLAFGVGRLMAEPIGHLMRAGAALGQGKPVSPVVSTLREADELSLVLSDAARELEARMRAQAHLAAIVSSSPSAIVSLAPDGIIRTWNAAAERLFGYSASEAIGQTVDMLSPEDARQAFEKLYASVRAGETVHADVVRRRKDGRLIDVAINVAPMYDDAGRLVGISSMNRDISERKARERHIEFLMRELAHRSKNLLAVVQAIAGQTARNSPNVEEFQKRFSQRVFAMALSHDLLLASDWNGAAMADLVHAQLAPFADEASSRISASGPDLEIKPEAVQGITLALHELATNAAKYGALSVPEGRVAIAWEVRRAASGEARFRMSWRETGGPPVMPPERKGFGHTVISQMVASSLRAQVALDYAAAGVSWTLDAPVSSVTQATPAPEAQPAVVAS
jgi:PAS domain S-box-containing protein